MEVLPKDLSALKNTEYASLILTTCTPKFYATRRLLVFAQISAIGPIKYFFNNSLEGWFIMLKDISYIVTVAIEILLPIILAIIIWKKFKVSWAISSWE